MRWFSAFVLKIVGWKMVVTVPEPPKSVICVAPHTSNWDVPIGRLFYWALGRDSAFIIKKSWFVFPLDIIIRSWGGIPVDRSNPVAVINRVVQEFENRNTFHIAITPEGTRSAVKRWKMGFYQIALKAKVPIQLIYFDYAKKEIGLTKIIYPTGDEKADLRIIQEHYKDVTACHPERFYNPLSDGQPK